jgi:hypothetical protein
MITFQTTSIYFHFYFCLLLVCFNMTNGILNRDYNTEFSTKSRSITFEDFFPLSTSLTLLTLLKYTLYKVRKATNQICEKQ